MEPLSPTISPIVLCMKGGFESGIMLLPTVYIMALIKLFK